MADDTSSIVELVNKRLGQLDGGGGGTRIDIFDDDETVGRDENISYKGRKPWYADWGLGGKKSNAIILLIILAVAIYIAYATRKLAKVRC